MSKYKVLVKMLTSNSREISLEPNKKNTHTMMNNLLNERNSYEKRMMKASFNKNRSYRRKPYRTCRE
jgi:hypothetical protein